MLVALTGTPGTGKHRVADVLARRGYTVVDLNREAENRKLIAGVDPVRGAKEVDVEALDRELQVRVKLAFLVAHYAHRMTVNLAVVLRCHPRVLRERLAARGWSEAKVRENVEAEAIDVITQEAVARVPSVFEVDTTDRTPDETADAVLGILQGKGGDFRPGRFDWSDEVIRSS